MISFGVLTGGTLRTVRYCERLSKPVLVFDGLRTNAEDVAVQAAEFVRAHSIKVLNVAGPRESKHAGSKTYAELVVRKLFTIDGSR